MLSNSDKTFSYFIILTWSCWAISLSFLSCWSNLSAAFAALISAGDRAEPRPRTESGSGEVREEVTRSHVARGAPPHALRTSLGLVEASDDRDLEDDCDDRPPENSELTL